MTSSHAHQSLGLEQAVSVAVVTEPPLLQMENIVCGTLSSELYITWKEDSDCNQAGCLLWIMLVIASECIFI